MKASFKIALIYLALGVLWILWSDSVLEFLDKEDLWKNTSIAQTLKGLFYVLFTAVMLYFLVKKFYQQLSLRISKFEKQYAELLEIRKLTNTGAWEVDLKRNQFKNTAIALEIYGFEPGKSTTIESIISFYKPGYSQDTIRKLVESCLNDDIPFDAELEIVSGEGVEKWVRITGKSEFKKGKCIRLYGTIQDITKRRYEEDLRRLLGAAINESNEAICITKADPSLPPSESKIVFVNRAFSNIVGYPPKEIVGKNHAFLRGNNTDSTTLEKINTDLIQKRTADIDILNYTKTGDEVWINISVSALTDEKGTVTHWVSVQKDVTERKKIEIQKELISEISQIFQEESPIEQTLERVLSLLVSFGGFDLAEAWLVNSDHDKIILTSKYIISEELQKFYNKTTNVTSFKKGEGFPGQVWESNRSLYWEDITKNPLFSRKEAASFSGLKSAYGIPLTYGGNLIGSLILALPDNRSAISTHTEFFETFGNHFGAEIRRKQLQYELNHIFLSAPDVISIVGEDGSFKKINPAMCETLGYSEKDILTKNIYEYLHSQDREKVSRQLNGLKEQKPPVYFEARLVSKVGQILWFSWTATRHHDQRILIIAKEITEKKHLENLLDKANKLARIGSWEASPTSGIIYCSDIAKEIFEVEDSFNPNLDTVISFYKNGYYRNLFETLLNDAIESGATWDEELLIITSAGNERWIRLIGQTEFVNDKCVRLFGSVQDIHEKKKVEVALSTKSIFLIAVTQIIESFLKHEDWHTTLENSFKIAADTIMVDRVYYFENYYNARTKKNYTSQKVEWVRKGISKQIDNSKLQNVNFDAFGDFMMPLANKEAYKAVVSHLPKGKTRRLLELQDIKSILAIPVFIGDDFRGFVGFDDCTTEREWTNDECAFLETLTTNLAFAIQRRETELKVKQAFEEKNTILESIGDAFFAVNKGWVVTYWNQVAEAVLGIEKDNILGKNIWRVFPGLKRTPFYTNYQHAITKNKPVHFEEYYAEQDMWVEVSAYPSASGLSVYFRDVTQRNKAIESLRLSNERFEKVTEATNDAIWDWEIDKDIVYRGDGFRKLFGYNVAKLEPTLDSWVQRIHPEDREDVLESLQIKINDKNESYFQHEYRYKKADGEYAYVIDRGAILRDTNQIPVRMVGAMQDITHRREYEESLEKLNAILENKARELALSNKELEQFAYVTSHDLQEPLRMITGFITQLDKKYGHLLDEKGKTYIHYAVDGAERMRQIILDLLEYSRLGSIGEEREDVDLNEIVHETTLLYHRKISELKAKIIWKNLPTIKAHKSPIRQIFQNLINNGLIYVTPGIVPLIEIDAKEADSYWQFCVKDNGIGIEAESHEKIFTIFKRLHTNEDYPGTGMGLAICKKVVEQYGGKIWIDSTKNQGSRFYFTIPK